MTLLPAIAFAAAMVYLLSDFIGRFFSPNVTAVIDLLLFVVIMTATHTLLKNLRDGR